MKPTRPPLTDAQIKAIRAKLTPEYLQKAAEDMADRMVREMYPDDSEPKIKDLPKGAAKMAE